MRAYAVGDGGTLEITSTRFYIGDDGKPPVREESAEIAASTTASAPSFALRALLAAASGIQAEQSFQSDGG